MDNKLWVGIDNGLSGGITVIDGNQIFVYRMPTVSKVVNKKNKKTYDLDAILAIFMPFFENKREVVFGIETISLRQGEGAVSAMTIGANFGKLIGIAKAYGFEIFEIRPQRWKKGFSELESAEIVQLREQLKSIKEVGKTIKDVDAKKENKKEAEKLARQIKEQAKDGARLLVSKLYPNLADNFEKKNSDGVAESLLICRFLKDNYDELVQNS